MSDPTRREVVARSHTLVVKVGTNVLTSERGELDTGRVRSLADQIERVRGTGRRVALVSSGAIGAGVGRLGLERRPTDLRELQACAAVGQSALMQAYHEAFRPHGTEVGQILLSAGDFDSRSRYLNVRNTVGTLFEWRCLPVINENDTVSTAEIKFGDNDHLAAMVANLLQAPLLILLTNVAGLYTADPRADADARLVPTVPYIDEAVAGMAGETKSVLGTGGMGSKLRAARLATAAGGAVVMADGARPGVLDEVMAGEPVGTLFLPHGDDVPAWKRWLGFTARPRGTVTVDDGAARAVREQGKSLLPIGVSRLEGEFDKGDVLAVCDAAGREFARGLSNYDAAEARQIVGLRTEQIAGVLGHAPYAELIHRDNLAVTG